MARVHSAEIGAQVLIDRKTGVITSFDSANDLFLFAINLLPPDIRFSEFMAVMRSDAKVVTRKTLDSVAEMVQQEIDRRSLKILKGSEQ